MNGLSKRQMEIVGVILWWPHLTNKEVAKLLGISHFAIKKNMNIIMKKLKIRARGSGKRTYLLQKLGRI